MNHGLSVYLEQATSQHGTRTMHGPQQEADIRTEQKKPLLRPRGIEWSGPQKRGLRKAMEPTIDVGCVGHVYGTLSFRRSLLSEHYP